MVLRQVQTGTTRTVEEATMVRRWASAHAKTQANPWTQMRAQTAKSKEQEAILLVMALRATILSKLPI